MIQKTRGMQDNLDMKNYHDLVKKISHSLANQGFAPIKLPTIEYAQLFEKTLGNETDVISKEIFLVSSIRPDDHEEKAKIMCLRPEGTAQIMRAYFENGIQQAPWKAFTIGSYFRYERPQKGRYREFSQASVEIINGKSVYYDCELLINLCFLFDTLGLKDTYSVHINFIGSYEERAEYNTILLCYISEHIKDKISPDEFNKLLKSPLKLFDSKNPICREYAQKAPHISNHFKEQSQYEWNAIKQILLKHNITFIHNPMIIRGLDYYNGIVFEFIGTSTELGAQNVFCGGGRYDRLSLLLDNKKEIPSIGAGIGIERLLLALEGANKHEKDTIKKNVYFVIIESEHEHEYALDIALELQKKNITTAINHDCYGIKNGFKKANALNATHVIIVGENERSQSTLTLKNLETGEQISDAKNIIIETILNEKI